MRFEPFWNFRPLNNSYICLADGDAPQTPPGGPTGDSPPPAGDTPPAANNAATAPPDSTTAPADPPAPPQPAPDWRDRQIDRQHRKIKDLETQAGRAAELAAENERLKQLVEARAKGDPTPPAAPAQRQQAPAQPAAAPAGPIQDPVSAARFQIQVEEVTNKLQNEYAKEWPEAAEHFKQVGGIPPDVMNDVLATDDAAYVLVTLGKNPGRFQELLDMPEARRRNALFKIGQEKSGIVPAAKPKPSAAPEPPAALPRGGGAPIQTGGDLYNDKLPDDAWYAERMKQKRESKGRPWSYGGRAN